MKIRLAGVALLAFGLSACGIPGGGASSTLEQREWEWQGFGKRTCWQEEEWSDGTEKRWKVDRSLCQRYYGNQLAGVEGGTVKLKNGKKPKSSASKPNTGKAVEKPRDYKPAKPASKPRK